MRRTRLWARLLGVLQGVIVEEVSAEEDEDGEMAAIVVAIRLQRREARRCGICRKRSPKYDRGEGRRRWRALDLGTVQTYIEAEAPRVTCRVHEVVVAAVPWARHGARHTRAFDDTAAWLDEARSRVLGISLVRPDPVPSHDERGRVRHESRMRGNSHVRFGGRSGETDQPRGWHRASGRPYWATRALDEVRRAVWNEARRNGQRAFATELKGARFALWKNPEDLTERQQGKLAMIQRTNNKLYRAYLLKEQLRQVFYLRGAQGMALLDHWLSWARRCRIPAFVKLAAAIKNHRAAIDAALIYELSNARVESVNTKIRLITRMAFGFRSAQALIALAMLSLGGLCPPLPGRS